MGAAEEAAGVAALLKEWKDRSGYSYGVLAKRLHMSTSTLHRYCNGDAVPTEYAPLERLARLCRATPDELVELHRRWILADEARRRERDRRQGGGAAAVAGAGGEREAGSGAVTASGAESEPVTMAGADSESETEPECGSAAKSEPEAEPEAGSGLATVPPAAPAAELATSASASPAPPISTPISPPISPALSASGPGQDAEQATEGQSVPQVTPAGGRRRIALAAGIAAAAVAASAALVAGLASSGGGDGREAAAGAATTTKSGSKPAKTGGGRPASASAKPPAEDGASPSPSPSSSRTPAGKASGGAGDRATGPGTVDRTGLPVSVDVRPYSWEDPCSQRYLVDRDPGEMPPPPAEQVARGWISALGAVSADSQLVQLSVQGAGDETVVLHALRVRVVGSSAPPAWNAYSMGVGCGGGITPKVFGVSLDAAQPRIAPQNGQRDFPYKVSERDPEVFKVIARAGARDVRWYMELEWSSGNRHGTLRIDDNGEPFHTSGMAGRPQYDYPLGGSKWIPAPKENG
ncbi:helix-turn-helix domain-containing protein [Streptomyces auratus]|uniref:Helix-turn-helix domain-containing protein n=3 Tax=Streptomyces auratus AGR0001 TaxID=1160718 RepID=A0A8B1NFG6_9ACTN|nr:helix-turn-helix transcriptional regulator [Streptomyces auratus]QTZ90317.1 helix-turn-helix domain-containing protein [Streptomyces auratus AGR0001]